MNKAAQRSLAERKTIIKVVNKLYEPIDFYDIKNEVESQHKDFVDRLSVMHVLSELCDKNLIKYEHGKYAKTTDEDLCKIFGIE